MHTCLDKEIIDLIFYCKSAKVTNYQGGTVNSSKDCSTKETFVEFPGQAHLCVEGTITDFVITSGKCRLIEELKLDCQILHE